MTTFAITKKQLNKLAHSLKLEVELPFSFEIQEDGKFLLVSIDSPADELLGERVERMLAQVLPSTSWMAVFIQGGQVVDSYCGGNI
jgi:hypothetical protein